MSLCGSWSILLAPVKSIRLGVPPLKRLLEINTDV